MRTFAGTLFTLVMLACAAPALAQTVTIAGRVLDAEARTPVAGADVRLHALPDGPTVSAVTTDDGTFSFAGVTAGRYVALVERIGYVAMEYALEIEPGVSRRLDLMLPPEPVELPDIAAEGRSRAPLSQLAGFHDRRERGIGWFMTREELDARQPQRMADIFRRVPGAQVHPMADGHVAIFVRVRNADGRPCIPAVFVDGVPYVMTTRGLDDFTPANIEAIEVYSGPSRIPVQFNVTGRDQPRWRNDQIVGNPRCGVIVLWLRGHEG